MNYVIDENKSLVNVDIQEIAFNAAHPVGEIYIQFPGKEDPQTLYGRGSWDNISNEFAGLFFRAEGGNANAFGGGSQEDKIREIKGSRTRWLFDSSKNGSSYTNGYGVFGSDGDRRSYNYGYGQQSIDGTTHHFEVHFNANDGDPLDNPMAGHADGPEIRPVNTTIRIWQRTA